jgi:hypothetical protein
MAADQYSRQDHYDALGLERRATAEDVKNAYRLRSHMFHPDKYENYPEPLRTQLKAEAAKEFKRITAAYDVLRDPAKRAVHDRQLDNGAVRAGTRGGGYTPTRSGRTARSSSPRPATVREATDADREPRATRTRRPAAEPRPRQPDPMLVVRPDRLDFGVVQAGGTKQLPLRISNAGGRTLFGDIASNRSWLSVNRKSFVSSSALVLVSIDTSGLRPGEEYAGALTVTTLNGGDQVVPVSARVSGKPEPILAGAPSLLDFGRMEAGAITTRTVRLTNVGTGTLIGSVAVKGDWLAVSESAFRQNDLSFQVIVKTAGMRPGEHQGEVLVYTNGGQALIQVLVDVSTPPGGGAIITRPAQPEQTEDTAASAGATPAAGRAGRVEFSKEDRDQLLRRIMLVEPETVWEREFLRRIVHLIRSDEALAPGELAKIYEMEARKMGQDQ